MLMALKNKVLVVLTIMLLSVTILITSQPYFRNTVKVLGRSAYFIDTVSDAGFINRDYYEKNSFLAKEKLRIASSFGYDIMDDIVDIDNDGIDELLCTCTWGGDGVVQLLVYKAEASDILCGTFTPEGVGASDLYCYGSGAFLTYYSPYTGQMTAEYTTIDGAKTINLYPNQIEFQQFSEGD